MAVPLYDAYVPMFLRGLNNLEHILKKGEDYTKEKGIPESEVLNWRLAPDMLPLTFQIQTVCNGMKNALNRVTGHPVPTIADDETTFAQLHQRIAATIDLLKSVDPKVWEGKGDTEVVIKLKQGELKFTGLDYLQNFAVPNFYFHISILYALFRANGAPLGKRDLLSGGV
jgi:hypothetical protein